MTVRSFDPQEFLRVADSLVSQDTSEASLRTAVGRIYYAVFLSDSGCTWRKSGSRPHPRKSDLVSCADVRQATRENSLERLFEGLRVAWRTMYWTWPSAFKDMDWQRNYQMARRLANFVLERLR